MAIDYSQRPAGMSKREYAASVLGGSKEDYDSSGNKKSSGGGSSSSSGLYKPKTYSAKDFMADTSATDQAYAGVRGTYTDQLTALKPRYEELYKQLEAEKELATQKNAQLSGQEDTQQKVNLAKRGVSTDNSNAFFTTEQGKLDQQQAMRDQETNLGFAGKRLDISGAESADTRDITTALANLDLSHANTIQGIINNATNLAASANSKEKDRAYQSGRDKVADDQWAKTFAFTKSKDAADRALEMYKLTKNETNTNNDKYNSALSSLVSTAYTSGNPAPYTRENIARQMKAAFPKMSAQIDADIAKFFPNGWEGQASGGSGLQVKTDESGRAYIEY